MVDVKPSDYIMGIVMFVFMIVAGMAWFAEFNAEDSTMLDSDKYAEFEESFDVVDDVTTQVEEIEESISGADSDFGLFGVLNALVKSAWQSLKLLFSSFEFMDDVYSGSQTVFGVPTFVATMVGLIITVIIAFGIYSLIFQGEA